VRAEETWTGLIPAISSISSADVYASAGDMEYEPLHRVDLVAQASVRSSMPAQMPPPPPPSYAPAAPSADIDEEQYAHGEYEQYDEDSAGV
jgi:hypothetical protein